MTKQHEVPQVQGAGEEQVDQFDSASEEDDDLLQTSTNVTSLGEGSLFYWSFVEIRLIHRDYFQDSSHNYVVIVP